MSTFGRVEQALEARAKFLPEAGGPRVVNQPDVDQVAEVRPILVTERGELDADECLKLEDAELPRVTRFSNIWVGDRFVRADLLVCEDDMNALPSLGIGAVEEHETGRMPLNESNRLQSRPDAIEIPSAHENVHVLRIPNRRLIDRRHPRGGTLRNRLLTQHSQPQAGLHGSPLAVGALGDDVQPGLHGVAVSCGRRHSTEAKAAWL